MNADIEDISDSDGDDSSYMRNQQRLSQMSQELIVHKGQSFQAGAASPVTASNTSRPLPPAHCNLGDTSGAEMHREEPSACLDSASTNSERRRL